MSGREVRAAEILQDIKAGMGDSALMEKYKLSSIGLQSLYQKLIEAGLLRRNQDGGAATAKRTIKVKKVMEDIESGMGKSELMEKYGLSASVLQGLCSKLLNQRTLNPVLVREELTLPDPTLVLDRLRDSQRHYLDFELPIYEASRPDVLGMVNDITEEGVGLTGIPAKVNEVKKFVVLGDLFGEVVPFEFEGICRWSTADPSDGRPETGFFITHISERDFLELKKVIRLVTFQA